MKKVMLVFGTRPEAIKMCPVIRELKSRPTFQTVVCVTGQHNQMLSQVLDVFQVEPDYNLSIMKEAQTLFDITVNILCSIRAVLEKENPDVVLVHGDTTTTFTAALACFYLKIPIGHVEAGLRTYDIFSPYPEEFNRQAVDIVSNWYFAPTQFCRDILLKEGKPIEKIHVTGNTVIDALRTTISKDYSHPVIDWASNSRMVLLTAHRRENLGEPMCNIFSAIRRVVDESPDIKVVYPVHLSPAVKQAADQYLGGHPRIRLIEPLDVIDFHNFLAKSYLILTDSGGIQEEAPSLGKPVLVLRNTTERPEGVKAGTLKLVGVSEDAVYSEFKRMLNDKDEYCRMSSAKNPYGDGHASRYIVDILESCDFFDKR